MKARCWLVAAAVLSLLPAAARAQGLAGRFMIAAQVGTQSEVSGDILQSARGTLLDKPVTIDSVRYRDVYAPDLRLQLTLGYGVGERTELIGRATWYESHWTGIEAGRLDGDPLFAFFEPNDYEEVGFEIGVRYYLATQSRLKSYVAPIVGVRFLNEILVSVLGAGRRLVDPLRPVHQGRRRAGVRPGHRLQLRPRRALLHRHGHGHPLPVGARRVRLPARPDAVDDSDGRWSAPVTACWVCASEQRRGRNLGAAPKPPP